MPKKEKSDGLEIKYHNQKPWSLTIFVVVTNINSIYEKENPFHFCSSDQYQLNLSDKNSRVHKYKDCQEKYSESTWIQHCSKLIPTQKFKFISA